MAVGIGWEFGKVIGDRFFPTGEDEVWVGFGEGLENEPSQVGAGMGEGESGGLEGEVAVGDEVQVEGARGVADGGTGATGFGFPGEEMLQELMRIEMGRGEEGGDGVDERGGMGRAIDRTGGPEGGGLELGGGEILEAGKRLLDGVGGVGEVGAEGDDDRGEGRWGR